MSYPNIGTVLATDYLAQFKSTLPLSKSGNDTNCRHWLKSAISRYNKFCNDNNLNIYTIVDIFDFYNSAEPRINQRKDTVNGIDTRWIVLNPILIDGQPSSFNSRKLLSVNLQAMIPESSIVLPPNISFLSDILIGISNPDAINLQVPAKNTGLSAIINSTGFVNALSLDTTNNTFDDIEIIKAMFCFRRYPNFPAFATEVIDVPDQDLELVINYGIDESYKPYNAPRDIRRDIAHRENEILYGD